MRQCGLEVISEHCFVPLTPTAFLTRAAGIHGERTAIIDGEFRMTYTDLLDRSLRLAGALRSLGLSDGDRIATLSPNVHALLEVHFGVPFAKGVLVALNTRLHARELADIMEHSGARLLIHDSSLAETASAVASMLGSRKPRLIMAGSLETEYEALVSSAPYFATEPDDERSLISINYTSGTTGRPKGVMYHHRGAYLQSLAMAFHLGLNMSSVFLWTLPMFHCNGWCFPWAVTAAGASHICLRSFEPEAVWHHIEHDGVTHLNAAPTVLTMLSEHPAAKAAPRRLTVATGGSAPSSALIARLAELNADVTHLYGLTETFGPIAVCDWKPEWDALPVDKQCSLKTRQGVGNLISEQLRVVRTDGSDVPSDGLTLGEVAVRGNNVMSGYFRDDRATMAACRDGWFRTGDLAVRHPDGYVELKDRAKDLIISAGENISTIEVERAISSHPAVSEVAVVGVPDDRWGERPAAYVMLKVGASASDREIIDHVRGQLAHYKAPDTVEFGPLPKSSTGKILKSMLRDAARSAPERRKNWQGASNRSQETSSTDRREPR